MVAPLLRSRDKTDHVDCDSAGLSSHTVSTAKTTKPMDALVDSRCCPIQLPSSLLRGGGENYRLVVQMSVQLRMQLQVPETKLILHQRTTFPALTGVRVEAAEEKSPNMLESQARMMTCEDSKNLNVVC